MPSKEISNGKFSFEGVTKGSISERYLAEPALLMIKFSLISLSFESLLSESNILSSPNTIVTLDHGIGIWFKWENISKGLLPPETTKVAYPFVDTLSSKVLAMDLAILKAMFSNLDTNLLGLIY